MIRLILMTGALALTATTTTSADAQKLRERIMQRMGQRDAATPIPGKTEHAYGKDALQRLDFWPAERAGGPTPLPTPLIVFVHGGGWEKGDKSNTTGAAKVAHFRAQGYAVASVNYRLVPNVRVEDQAADVASALAWLRTNAANLGVDPARIVLMGHSAGAHLVALVGTDPSYTAAAGFPLASLRGVIPLDGAAYDVPSQIADGGRLMHDTYLEVFGTDPARQAALSPTRHAAAPNAPAFLLLHVDRADGTRQANALGAALTRAGTPAQVTRIEGRGLIGHMEINRKLGETDYPATPIVDAWIKAHL